MSYKEAFEDLEKFINSLKNDRNIFYKLNEILMEANNRGHNCEQEFDCKLFAKFLIEHGVTIK